MEPQAHPGKRISGYMGGELSHTHRDNASVPEFDSLPHSNPNPVLRIDPVGELLFCNEAAENLASSLGFPSSLGLIDIQVNGWEEIIPPWDQTRIHESTYQNGQTYRWYLVREKHTENFACYGFETSDLKHCEIALIESQRMEWIGQTAATIAHDFNNYLGAIIMAVESAEDAEKAGKPAGKFLELARNTAQQATQLSRRLSDFGKSSDRKMKWILLRTFFESRIDLFKSCLGKEISLNLDSSIQQEDACLYFDPALLEQVLMNLLVNAKHAVEERQAEKGEVTIACQVSPEGNTQLIVEDNGIGMDKRTRSRIFAPFYTTKEKGHGSGLGLFAVLAILKESGGGIEVNSEPGNGTRFILEFPRA